MTRRHFITLGYDFTKILRLISRSGRLLLVEASLAMSMSMPVCHGCHNLVRPGSQYTARANFFGIYSFYSHRNFLNIFFTALSIEDGLLQRGF